MEYYNEKLLTKGLPEIIAQFTPYNYYPITKVIVHSRKSRKGLRGMASTNILTESYDLHLWPTTICFSNNDCCYDRLGFEGTYSFRLWRSMLFVSLHELGHFVTQELVPNVSEKEYRQYGQAYQIIENAANDFATRTIARIAEVDPRLGQPSGALTGFPGILAYERREGSFNEIDKSRIAEWRGMKCDAQIPIGDVVKRLSWLYAGVSEYQQLYPMVNRIVHTQAKELGIDRYFINRNGWHYLMFNFKEACDVFAVSKMIVKQALSNIKLSFRKLYKRYGNLTEAEIDGDTLKWLNIQRKAVADGTQKTLDLGIPILLDRPLDPGYISSDCEPDDIPF